MSDDFYRAFEEKYRGSRELIKSRQRVYLPFIEPLQSIYGDARAIDLGCGRGEWLELLEEKGFNAQGVDLDDGMLAACRELGLNVATADALAALKALPDESQVVVSGFHIAEHLPFSYLQILAQEALRVLKPAGLFILETPNPENIVVGTCNFYLDPTHQQPIPSQLLSFITEYYGFARTKILRVQESVDLSYERILSLLDVLGRVSPDYAVVAQKAADKIILEATSQAFEPEYGVSLEALAAKYDSHAELRALQAETIAHAAESRALQAETIAHAAESRALQAETIAHAAESRALKAETIANAAETRALQVHETLHNFSRSNSWRITALLRWFSLQAITLKQKGLGARASAVSKKVALPILRRAVLFVNVRPELRIRCVALTRKFGLYQYARSLYLRMTGQSHSSASPFFNCHSLSEDQVMKHLTARGLRIYVSLKAAIEKHQEIR